MAAEDRNFSDYQLGDNVYWLADGLIPEIADHFELEFDDEPSSEVLGRLVGIIGQNKVLRDNAEIQAIDLTTAADFVERSGVQKPLARSLWTPDTEVPYPLNATIVTGAVANWQDRTARLLSEDSLSDRVFLPVGNRVMNSATELANPNVQAYQEENGSVPSESEYAANFVVPLLEEAGYRVRLSAYETDNGDEVAVTFVSEYPELFRGLPRMHLSFARVANAGIQLAVQFRKAAKAQHFYFDANPYDPQVFVQTDSLPVARTAEQVATPTEFQSPFTALRQVALTAKLLHEAAGGR